jgi:hypothetical protein
MLELRIEPGEGADPGICPVCAGRTWAAHGFIFDGPDPRGLYYLDWCDGEHEVRNVYVTLSLGDFGDDSSPGDRRAFGLYWTAAGMTLAETPGRDRPELFGRFVPRYEAEEHYELGELRIVADRIGTQDPLAVALGEWLDGGPSPVSKL